jgi:hypothetical protein
MQGRRIAVHAISLVLGFIISLAFVYLYIPLPFPAGYHIGFGTDISRYRIWFDGDLMAFQALAIAALIWIWLDYFLGTEMLPK